MFCTVNGRNIYRGQQILMKDCYTKDQMIRILEVSFTLFYPKWRIPKKLWIIFIYNQKSAKA